MICPICSLGHLHPSAQKDEVGTPIYSTCKECGTIKLNYNPMKHQQHFHQDNTLIKMFAGGYGSGKTRTGAEETVLNVLKNPGGMTFIGAPTVPQLEKTAKKMFLQVFPQPLIEEQRKNYILAKNGHEILFGATNEEENLRSLNLSNFWIEEASGVKFSTFDQLRVRLRNPIAKHRSGIITSNPDLGWIREEVLMKAAHIHNAQTEYHQDPNEIDPNIAVHIAPTHLNHYLPDNYIETVSKNKPDWWINRFLKGSFEYSEGMVYPMFADHIIEPFDVPKHWERIFAADFGYRDPTVMLELAIDPRRGIVYVINEHYENMKDVKYHSTQMNRLMDGKPYIRSLVGDPKGKAKSERDNQSLFDHYGEYGIWFKPGINKIEDGVMKVFTYFMLDKLKVFNTCRHTIKEGINYKYPEQELNADKNAGDKPIDKDNHAMDSLRYGINELPDDPDQLLNIGVSRYTEQNALEPENIPHALRTESEPTYGDWLSYY